MTTFTFTDKHILDSALQADHGPLSFTTDTTYGVTGNEETTLTPQSTTDLRGILVGVPSIGESLHFESEVT